MMISRKKGYLQRHLGDIVNYINYFQTLSLKIIEMR